jgi:hypothetical protein
LDLPAIATGCAASLGIEPAAVLVAAVPNGREYGEENQDRAANPLALGEEDAGDYGEQHR